MNEIFAMYATLQSLFLDNPTAQTVGFFGFAMSLLTFLSNNNEKFMIRMTLSSAIWALHFLLLGAMSAGLLNTVDVVKNILAIKYPFNKKISTAIVFIYIAIGYYMYAIYMKNGEETEKIISLIPVFASIVSTIILFTLKGIAMRVAFLIMLFGWLTYNLYNGSIGGASTDVVLLITGIIGIYTTLKTEKK